MKNRYLCTVALWAIVTGSLWSIASMAVTQEDGDLYSDYFPAATIIKCPHIPLDMLDIPSCEGKVAMCVGTDGRDLIIGTDGDDVIVAGDGADVVHADAGDDVVCGGFGDDSLFGARGNDVLIGEDGNDWLFGAKGKDLLVGGPGDFDVLWGGPGIDILDGGEGENDICMLQREMGKIEGGCETEYPPPGYVHEEEPEPGILKIGKVD